MPDRLLAPRARELGVLILSGALLGFSFPPSPCPWLAWVALAPLLRAWDAAPSWYVALRHAFVAFLTTFAVAFSWPLFHVMPHVGLASLNGLLFLPLWMALPFGLSWLVKRRLGRTAGIAALLALYLSMEAGLRHGPFALPWTLLGHTQAEALLFNQFADLTGTPGLTLWVLALNVLVFKALASTGRKRHVHVTFLVLLAGAPLAYGTFRAHGLPPEEGVLHVGLVQPGSSAMAWADLTDSSRVDYLIALSDSLLAASNSPLDLIVWPETAVPFVGDPESNHAAKRRLQAWARTKNVALLTGAITARDSPGEPRHYRNDALLFEPDEPMQRYSKRRLVPFAERVPLIEHWSWLEALTVPAGGVAGYEPGSDGSPLKASAARVGVLICLETTFGELGRHYARDGAEALIAITQDGWWGQTAGYRQHLAFTRLRAIETRRAVAQVSVSGTTTLILPDGSTPFETNWMERVGHTAELPLYSHQTFYTRHGDWLNGLAYLGALLLLALTAVAHVRNTSTRHRQHAYA